MIVSLCSSMAHFRQEILNNRKWTKESNEQLNDFCFDKRFDWVDEIECREKRTLIKWFVVYLYWKSNWRRPKDDCNDEKMKMVFFDPYKYFLKPKLIPSCLKSLIALVENKMNFQEKILFFSQKNYHLMNLTWKTTFPF